MAASTLTVLPSFLFVFFLQKYLLRGFRAGGIG
jgi:multiple sugar transport system permease protein